MSVESGVSLNNTKLPKDKCLILESLFKTHCAISFEIKQDRIEVNLKNNPFVYQIEFDTQWSVSLVPKGSFIDHFAQDDLYDEVDGLLSSWNQHEIDPAVIHRMNSIKMKFIEIQNDHPELVKNVEVRHPAKIRLHLNESEYLPSYLEAGHCDVMEQWYVHMHRFERKQALPPPLHSFVRGIKHTLTEWNINIIGISC